MNVDWYGKYHFSARFISEKNKSGRYWINMNVAFRSPALTPAKHMFNMKDKSLTHSPP